MSATQTPTSVPANNSNISTSKSTNDSLSPSLVAGNRNGVAAGGEAVNAGVRGEVAVSMAKGPVASGQGSAQMINFGSVHDQNPTALSSSPAGPAQAIQNAPTKFGTVAADVKPPKDKVIGFAGSKPEGASPAVRSLDFNKMFQTGGGGSTQGSPMTASNATETSAATSKAAKTVNGTSSTVQPGGDVSSPSSQPPIIARSNVTGNPRPSNAGRPFESHRTPSQTGHPGAQPNPSAAGARVASATHSGFNPHQQPRSPHMGGQAPPMQAMPHLNGAQWQGQQPQMYYPPMYQAYGYAGMPQQMPQMGQQWMSSQPGSFEASQGQPRSPRHLPASASQNTGTPGTPSISSATAGLSSPATSQRSVPHTPSSMTSPPAAHHIGMGLPQSRPPNYQPANSQGFATHSPSHSFSSNAMNASARQFEPSQSAQPLQKRTSSAIKIVDPNTKAAVEFKTQPKKDVAPGTPTSASASVKGADAAPAEAKSASGSPAPQTSKAVSTPPPAIAMPSSNKLETSEDFMKRVRAAAEDAKRLKDAKLAAENEESTRKANEIAEAKAKEDSERKLKEAAEEEFRKKKAEEEAAAAAAVAAAAERQKEEEQRAASNQKAAEEASSREGENEMAPSTANKTSTAPQANDGQLDEATVAQDDAKTAAPVSNDQEQADAPTDGVDTIYRDDGSAGKEFANLQTPSFKGSAADVERMAREASSVPSTPLEGNAPRLPSTPRTPGTPGLASLPAKPISSMTSSNSGGLNGIKLDNEALERRRKATPTQLDITSAQQRSASADAPVSAASAALGSARFIDDFSKVSYPDKIQSPRPELNQAAEPGKFRYDRDFLLQFMSVYKERPNDLPPLSSIGMDSSQAAPARGAPGRRASGMGPPAAPGRSGSVGLGLGSGFGGKGGGMGQFSHPGKTSEERFAASSARSSVGAFGSSGPMGAFNAGARSQPLSRTGSGSNAIPTREAMGTGMPSGGRTSSRRGKDRRDPGRSGVNPPEKGGPTIPMDQVVPLSHSENRWVGNRGQNVKPDSPEMVTRKVKALLNKLTLERFDSISTQILDWANKSVDETDGQTLRIVIALIFEKATDEAAWSEMYATLCRKIMEKLDPNIQDENIKTNDDKPVMGGHLFRKYLVNRCQEDFERGWAQRDATAAAAKSKEAEDNAKKAENEKKAAEAKEAQERGEKVEEQKEAELLSDEYYEAQKAKRRGLGLVRFIGELFKYQMLTEKIMHLCIQRLLSNATTPEEEEVESLCKLLTTIGKLLDEGKARSYVDVYFKRMDEMMSHAAMTQRMKFMLQDVIELRQSHWKPRHDNTAPKTIAQIHEDAAKAKVQAEMERASRMHMGGPMSRGGSRRGQQREQYGADGFITVGNQPPAPAHQTKAGNLSGFGKGIDRSGTSRPLSVGPQSVFARKNQKSDDGSNPPSRTASSQNIFSLLSSNNENSEAAQIDEPASSGRPKLNLAKRTKPLPGAEDDAKGDDELKSGKEDAEGDEEGDGEVDDMSDEDAKRRIDNDIKEFLEIKNVDEGKMAMESLPSVRRSDFVNKIVETVLNRKEEDVKLVGSLFSTARQAGLLDDEAVQAGVKDHVEFLDDISIDVPNAYAFMAILLVASGLSRDKIEDLASTIQGEGVKPPKDRLMAKVDEQQP